MVNIISASLVSVNRRCGKSSTTLPELVAHGLRAQWRGRLGFRYGTMSAIVWLLAISTAVGQSAVLTDSGSQAKSASAIAQETQRVQEKQWRAPSNAPSRAIASVSAADSSLESHRVQSERSAVPTRSGGKDLLPNDQGQVWRQYDISGYTAKVQGTEHPEQAIVDWILRETGTEVWFAKPLGLLNADRSTLSVYHTPEMQQIVAEMVGRFVNGTFDPQLLGLRLVAVNSPNWRTSATRILRPVEVQTVGVEAWLLSKENAAALLADLRRRSDFREYSDPNLVFYNGQPASLARLTPRTFVRSYRARQNGWPGYDAEMAQLQEGLSLQISALISEETNTIDAVIKCNIDQVERLVAVPIDLPGLNGQIQRAEIQVPQLVSWRMHDRFRWPADQVLLMSCGVVAAPGPSQATTFGIPNPFVSRPGRSDALLFVESKGQADQAVVAGATTTMGSPKAVNGARY